ncbi:recombination protein RecR [Marispirochaeta aestuarii]|uniref:Recombination protein RecR n=1 Tax=Marispirochaeta aestuarii TaxID=1963862 RepID=A0A1Y1RWP7_9SPIO|nr:recombination mediator RecR [Marispirochaeta aestuarii]ORC34598.1 recombination protein RecR [Marispirochaeta aestuarii]
MTVLDQLIRSLSRFPGVGKKSATRMAYFLLQSDDEYLRALSEQIGTLKARIRHCSVCGIYTEADPCDYCSDTRRDSRILCVVEQSQDVGIIESTGEYEGRYHILGGALSPIDGIGPAELNIDSLLRRLKAGGINEVIIATNPSVEGDTTALYLVSLVKDMGLTVSRLASGLPVGGDLEYADRLTLARSLKGRTKM